MQFNVSFDTADSPDLGSLTAAEQQAVLDTASAAAAIWSRYLTPANITLDLQIKVDNSLFSGATLAQGSPGDFVPTGTTFGGQQVYDAGSAIKLRTGQDSNGAQADLNIDLTVNSIRSMFFKTDDYAPMPAGDVDALSVFLREIDHGLGMYSLAQQPGAPGVSVYDTFVQNDPVTGNPVFTGYNGGALWAPPPGLPLDSSSVANIASSYDQGQHGSPPDLMTTVLSPATNAHISGPDIGILQDIGVPMNSPTEGDDVVYGLAGPYQDLDLQGGNDTAYAVPGGSILYGDAGNDRLIGNIGNDLLEGAADDDYLEGGGGNDILDGGTGFDIAHYSGVASDYRVTQNSNGTADITDLRPNSPDGTDRLSYIEELQWGDGSVTPLNTPPVVITQSISTHSNKTLALPSLFSISDVDGDAMTGYEVVEFVNSNDPQRGFFSVGGVRYSTTGPLYLTAAEMASATYTTGTPLTTTLEINAFDGTAWSNYTPLTITLAPDNPPVVTTANISAGHGQNLALSSLFSVSDADSDAITAYQIWDGTTDPASGYWVVNGVVQAPRTVIDVSAAQLAQTSFVTGSVGDSLQLRAFDGIAWSAAYSAQWSPFTITVPVNHAPVVTTSNLTPQRNQTLAASGLFSVSDADGDAMTEYQLWDATADPLSGHFTVGGVVQAPRTVIDISAAELAQTSFVTGSVPDLLQLRAFDGTAWSAAYSAQWSPFILTPTDNAPVVATSNLTRQGNQTLAASSLFSVSDADGDAMTEYQLWDGTTDPASGHFVVSGVTQAAQTVIDISAAQLAQTSFVTGSVGDSLQLRAFDGTAWSAAYSAQWSPFTITVPVNHAPVVTTGDLIATAGQSLAASSLFTVSDADGDAMTEYQFWDGTADPLSGHFVISGVAQAAQTVIDIPASQLGQVSFLAGTVRDTLQVRAFDGTAWSAAYSAQWSPFHITAT